MSRISRIIVISHDDHYYHVADRIVKLEYGKVEYDSATAELEPAVLEGGVLVNR